MKIILDKYAFKLVSESRADSLYIQEFVLDNYQGQNNKAIMALTSDGQYVYNPEKIVPSKEHLDNDGRKDYDKLISVEDIMELEINVVN